MVKEENESPHGSDCNELRMNGDGGGVAWAFCPEVEVLLQLHADRLHLL